MGYTQEVNEKLNLKTHRIILWIRIISNEFNNFIILRIFGNKNK